MSDAMRGDITQRLRGRYPTGPMLPNGEPEFGWRDFGPMPPINREAADEIERLRAALGAVKSERDALRAQASDILAENDALRFALNNASADVTRLRRPWLATIQTENSCPTTGGGCLSKWCGCIEEMEMLMREDDARALPLPGDSA